MLTITRAYMKIKYTKENSRDLPFPREGSIQIAPDPHFSRRSPLSRSPAHWENQGSARSPTYFGPLAGGPLQFQIGRQPLWRVTFHRWTSALLTHSRTVMSMTPRDRTPSDRNDDRHDPDIVESSIRNSEIDVVFKIIRADWGQQLESIEQIIISQNCSPIQSVIVCLYHRCLLIVIKKQILKT